MTFCFFVFLLFCSLCGCATTEESTEITSHVTGHMELRYAERFAVDYMEDGCAIVRIDGEEPVLVVPEGVRTQDAAGFVTLQLPLKNIYLADSAAADFFVQLDALDSLRFTSTLENNWTLPDLQDAMHSGTLHYVGKYSTPDYELLLSENTELAIENTMIYHSPETKEQLERLGIPVLTERSSYESHPLGRLEWVKLFGLLTGKLQEAEAFFAEEVTRAEQMFTEKNTGKTVVFFYISPNGYVNVRRSKDYIPKMIALAGGQYALSFPETEEDSMRSTMNMEMESFYTQAKDADILIYNATVDGGIETIEQLLSKGEWLADFKAVQEGNVWCTESDMFQQTAGIVKIMEEFYHLIRGTTDDTLHYFHKLRSGM